MDFDPTSEPWFGAAIRIAIGIRALCKVPTNGVQTLPILVIPPPPPRPPKNPRPPPAPPPPENKPPPPPPPPPLRRILLVTGFDILNFFESAVSYPDLIRTLSTTWPAVPSRLRLEVNVWPQIGKLTPRFTHPRTNMLQVG